MGSIASSGHKALETVLKMVKERNKEDAENIRGEITKYIENGGES